MSKKLPFQPFDPLLAVSRSISYRPHWNRLTGSILASILLQQIVFRWQRKDRRPFYKYAAPCPSARVGDSWQEELGFSRRQFERARAAIAVKTRRHLKDEVLKTNLVVYWTESNHRTYYAINESLLLTRLADALVSTGKVPPDAHHELWPIAAHFEDHRTATGNEQRAVGRTAQPSSAHNEQPPADEATDSCTEITRKGQQRDVDVVSGDEVDLDEELIDALARLGDTNPRELVARYPHSLIRRWLAYVHSPRGDNLRNKAGFIRAKLKESETHRQTAPSAGFSENAENARPEHEAQRIWSACLEELAQQLAPEEFSAQLSGTRAMELHESILRVAVDNKFARDVLNYTLRATIEHALAHVAADLSVEFIVFPN